MSRDRSERQAIVALAVLAPVWAFTWPLLKEGLRFADPFDFAALRGLPAAALLFAAMLYRGQPLRPVAAGQLVLLGAVQTAAFNLLVSLALVAGAAGKTSVLVYTFPFWTLVFARVGLGEKLDRSQWGAVALAACGLVLVVEPWALHGSIASGSFAIAAGACWAVSSVYAKRIRASRDLDLLSMSAWQTLFGGILLIAAAAVIPSHPVEWTQYFVAILIYSIVLGTAGGWFLWMFVLKQLPAGIASLGMLAVPVLGVLFSRMYLGERPGGVEISGMILIATALALLSWATLRSGHESRTHAAGAPLPARSSRPGERAPRE